MPKGYLRPKSLFGKAEDRLPGLETKIPTCWDNHGSPSREIFTPEGFEGLLLSMVADATRLGSGFGDYCRDRQNTWDFAGQRMPGSVEIAGALIKLMSSQPRQDQKHSAAMAKDPRSLRKPDAGNRNVPKTAEIQEVSKPDLGVLLVHWLPALPP